MSNIADWINQAPEDNKNFRRAVHIVLHAISINEHLKPLMIVKGGILLGIKYSSPRFTQDIDFSTAKKLEEVNTEEIKEELEFSLSSACDELTYNIECKIQSFKIQPKPRDGKEQNFHSIVMTIGYADKADNNALSRLNNKQSPHTVKIDYSFNEYTFNPEDINIEDDNKITSYSIVDIISEKYRAIIQQKVRNRSRNQDIYDINHLIENTNITETEKYNILISLIKKIKRKDTN